MLSRVVFVLATILCSTGLAAPTQHVCRIGTIVHRPNNNQTYSFPSSWNENQTAPHLAADQSCSWVVTIPQGYFAKLIIDGKINDTVGHFQMVDTNGNVVETQHENKEPYYFPSPKFTLIVNNEQPAKLGFKIIWSPYPQVRAIGAGIGGNPHLVNITQDVWASDFSAAPSVSLLAFPADPKNAHTLRSVMIFSSNSITDYNDKYINNLYELHKLQHQYVGQTNAVLYVINVEARGVLDKLLVQESSYTQDLTPYNELNCKQNSTCSKKLNGKPNQKSAFVSIDQQTHTLLNVQMDADATLSVYYGGITGFGFDKAYNGSTIKSQLPIDFYGGITQYVVSSGPSVFTFNLSDKKITN